MDSNSPQLGIIKFGVAPMEPARKWHLRADAVMQCHAMARTIECLRLAHALIGSTDALERFDAWRTHEGAIKLVLFQAVSKPNLFGGIRGGIFGISHFKPLIYMPM